VVQRRPGPCPASGLPAGLSWLGRESGGAPPPGHKPAAGRRRSERRAPRARAPGGRGPRRRSRIWLPPRQELAEDGVNAFAMRSDVSLDDAGWGSPTFHKMARAPGGGLPVQRSCIPRV